MKIYTTKETDEYGVMGIPLAPANIVSLKDLFVMEITARSDIPESCVTDKFGKRITLRYARSSRTDKVVVLEETEIAPLYTYTFSKYPCRPLLMNPEIVKDIPTAVGEYLKHYTYNWKTILQREIINIAFNKAYADLETRQGLFRLLLGSTATGGAWFEINISPTSIMMYDAVSIGAAITNISDNIHPAVVTTEMTLYINNIYETAYELKNTMKKEN